MLSSRLQRRGLAAVVLLSVCVLTAMSLYLLTGPDDSPSRSDVVQTGEQPSVDWPDLITCSSGDTCRVGDGTDGLTLRATYTFRGGKHLYRVFGDVYLEPHEMAGARVCFPPYQSAMRCVPLPGSSLFQGETAVYAQ